MLDEIVEASQNFCIHQIRAPFEIGNDISRMRTFIAYIDVKGDNGTTHRVYVGASPSFAQRVSSLLLEEDESDEETLIDMTLELTNLIVGSAKVLASQKETGSYTMSTPHFKKIDDFDIEYDNARILKVGNDEMIIALKEL